MRVIFRYLWVLIILASVGFIFVQQQNGSEFILSNAATAINPLNNNISKNSPQAISPIAKALKNLLDNQSSEMTFVFIKQGDKTKCNDPDGKCAEILKVKDKGAETSGTPTTRILTNNDWDLDKKYHVTFLGGNLFAAQLYPQTKKLVLLKLDVETLLELVKDFKIVEPDNNPKITPHVTPAIVPPFVWDWWTDSEGQCCSDCWAVHRILKLPCKADVLCCFGTCSIDPSCEDDVPPPGTLDPEDQCSGTYFANNVKADTGTAICDYTGEVTKMRNSTGECIEIASNGVFSNCVSKTVGGGISNDPDDDNEVRDIFDNW